MTSSIEEAIEHIFELVGDGRLNGRTHQVATVNVDFVVNALSDPTLRQNLRRTSLSIPDGMPIVWGSRLLGTPVRERVAGADLVPALGARAARTGMRLALFGAGPGVAERAAARLRTTNPELDVVADSGPSFGSVDDLSIGDLDWLVRANPDICCVAFGNPKQELFIDRFGDALGIPVMIGVGGTLDFLVGVQRRAPRWMQRSGLEWTHRLVSDPRRLTGRYLRDALVFLPKLAQQGWTGRAQVGRGAVRVRRSGDDVVVDLSDVEQFQQSLRRSVRFCCPGSAPNRLSSGDRRGRSECLAADSRSGRVDRSTRSEWESAGIVSRAAMFSGER